MTPLTRKVTRRTSETYRDRSKMRRIAITLYPANRFFAAIGARIMHGGQEAYYRPSTDTIHMPDEGLFTGTATMTRSEA
jgi:antirestriction protein ArdC